MESSRKVADISGNRNLENISRNEPFKPKLERKSASGEFPYIPGN